MNQYPDTATGASFTGMGLLLRVLLLGLLGLPGLLGLLGCAESPADTTDSLVRLTSSAARDGQPAFSPDGSQVAFVSNRGGSWQIWLLTGALAAARAESGPPRRLTDLPFAVGRPVFQPDGRHLLFYAGQGETWDIYRVAVPTGSATGNATGSGTRNATDSHPGSDDSPVPVPVPVPVPELASASSEYRPDPSIDGQWVVFDRWGASDPPNHDIHLLDHASGTVHQLTTDPAYDSDARISPNGSMILFHSDREGSEPYELQVYLMNRDGSGLQPLTHGPDRHGYPAWCPDGRYVVFTAESGDGPDHKESRIEVMDLETGKTTPVVTGRGKHTSPVVSPDGQWIVFSSDRFEEGVEDLWAAPISPCDRAAQTSR